MTADAKPQRRANGTFDKDSSGNPKGRPKKDKAIPHPQHLRDLAYDVARFEIRAEIRGEKYKLNLLQSNLMTLAIAGAGGDAKSAQAFLQHLDRASTKEIRAMEQLTKRLHGVTPLYKLETDPVRKAKLKKEWQEIWAEASGYRPSTTSGLKRVKKRD